ncbi:MAG: hypothetical protein ABI999_01835 [Acidobacteriota bacterium]
MDDLSDFDLIIGKQDRLLSEFPRLDREELREVRYVWVDASSILFLPLIKVRLFSKLFRTMTRSILDTSAAKSLEPTAERQR